MMLNGKVALVTGGSRGIGAAIVRVLAREGAVVAVNYAGSREKAEALAAEIRAHGGSAAAFQADVRDEAAVLAMTQQIAQTFGRLDAVINNALGGNPYALLDDATPEDYMTSFDFGCQAVIHTMKAARPYMKQAGGGRIVNIVTELWNRGLPGWSVYLAGKGAMVGISRSLAAELGPENITVNMVAPGWMLDEKVDPNSESAQAYASAVALRRQGSAEEIGKACAFFLSDYASFITGAYLPVTGGHIMQIGG
jgi:3-oxoacyl-[acyl-carrier protein] reductase